MIMIMTTQTEMDPCGEREVSEYLQEPHADAPGIVISYSFLTLTRGWMTYQLTDRLTD